MITTDDYSPGLQVLAHSIKKLTTKKIPLYCIVDENKVSETTQKEIFVAGCDAILTSPYDISAKTCKPQNKNLRASDIARWESVMNKLVIWNLKDLSPTKWFEGKKNRDQVKRMLRNIKTGLFLDADCLVLEDLDHLFLKHNEKKCQLSAKVDIGGIINSGVMAFQPERKTFLSMLEAIGLGITDGKVTEKGKPSINPYDCADQGVVHAFFAKNRHFCEIPFKYNANQIFVAHYPHMVAFAENMLDKEVAHPDLQKVAVFHYEKYKPWKINFQNQRNFFGDSEDAKELSKTMMKIHGLWHEFKADLEKPKH